MDCPLKGIGTPLQALFGYVYIGAVLTALLVPVAVAVMWYVVSRIRRMPLDENQGWVLSYSFRTLCWSVLRTKRLDQK